MDPISSNYRGVLSWALSFVLTGDAPLQNCYRAFLPPEEEI